MKLGVYLWMGAVELRSKLIQYVEDKTSDTFPISDSFLLACLDDAIRSTINSNVDGIKTSELYDKETLIIQALTSWKSTVKLFLSQNLSNRNIALKGVPVPPVEDHQELLSQVYQLSTQCGFE